MGVTRQLRTTPARRRETGAASRGGPCYDSGAPRIAESALAPGPLRHAVDSAALRQRGGPVARSFVRPDSRLLPALAAGGVALALVALVVVSCARPPAPSPSPGATTASPGASPSASPNEDELDTIEGIDGRVPVALPSRIELYAGAVSVTPGQPLTLHVSTTARQYAYTIERLDATLPSGRQVVVRSGAREGHDYRSLGTFDTLERTARANWPVTDTLDTTGWTPGVYIVTATDADGTTGRAIVVVRTPVLVPGRPAFVFTALTYQAYNLWGGANLYSYAAPRAVRVSFERPYAFGDGLGFWTRDDDRILRWLQLRGLDLQYTTDYDLAVNPPAVAPRLLIWPRHAEYVTASLRDWVERHVDVTGDMNVLNFGANGFYWQVRLPTPGRRVPRRTSSATRAPRPIRMRRSILHWRRPAGDSHRSTDPRAPSWAPNTSTSWATGSPATTTPSARPCHPSCARGPAGSPAPSSGACCSAKVTSPTQGRADWRSWPAGR